ncbi:MAG: type II toxin-antitoxin system VapC family toxin [Nitrospirae bacterium]|nr:type II toxin-antitoxin system VapC family toxin [Nitrospirota bacterium]
MKKPQLYLETSVWNFCFADDAPEKKNITLTFFDKIKQGEYDIFISDVVIEEIGRAGENKKQLLLEKISTLSPVRLVVNEQIVGLAQKYISEGVLPSNKIEDAMHAAVATFFEMDALISWNLKHLANLKKMEMINGINMKEGYSKRLELITPMEVSDEEV